MSDPTFAPSRAKLQRARRFIDELAANQQAYRVDPASVSIDLAEDPPVIEIAWQRVGLETGAIVGDAIHNMRTALDLMASELARLSGKSDSDVYFPFAATEADLDGAIRNKRFTKAGDDAVTLLKKFGPYRGGNDALRAIHDLDVQDKHTTILLVGHRREFQLSVDFAPWLSKGLEPIPSVQIEPDDIVFTFSDGPFQDRPVIETLKRLVELVEGIVEAFTQLVELRPPAS